MSKKRDNQVVNEFIFGMGSQTPPKSFVDLRSNKPAAPNATIGPRPSPSMRSQQRRQAHLTGNYPNPLIEPRGINQLGATPRRGDFPAGTAEDVKDFTKNAVGFYYGETPQEVATGLAFEAVIPIVGGALWKTGKGIYGAGKSIRQAYQYADSMVPGNRPPRPPRPKTPTAPVNPADVEGRRNVLKGGLVVAAGGAAAASKNVEEAVNFGQQVLRGLKGQGRRVLPEGFLQGFGKYNYQNLSKRFGKEMKKMTDDFSPEFDPNDFGGIGYVREEAANFVLDDMIQGVVSRTIPTLPQRAKKLLGLGKDAKHPFVMSDIEEGIEKAMLKNVHRSGDSKVQPLFNMTSHIDSMVGREKNELLAANARYRKRIQQHIDSQFEKPLTDMTPEQSKKYIEKQIKSLQSSITRNEQLLNSIDRAPTDLITEKQVRGILQERMMQNVLGEIKHKLGNWKGKDKKEYLKKFQEEIKKRLDDFDYINTVKRQRGKYAQNRTPFV